MGQNAPAAQSLHARSAFYDKKQIKIVKI